MVFDAEPQALDEVTEKELLLEIFREIRATRRLLVWLLFVAPLSVALLVAPWTWIAATQ